MSWPDGPRSVFVVDVFVKALSASLVVVGEDTPVRRSQLR